MSVVDRVREINQRYKFPHVKMTPGVKIALIMLRIYLIVLVGILFLKFFTLAAGR
jgi:hypothetical protein